MKDKRRSVGNKNELFVEKELQKQGYVIHRARASVIKTKTGYFCRSNDIFGAFDIIAKKKGEKTKWIQVSTGYRKSEKEKVILGLNIWNSRDEVEIWLNFKGGIWKIYLLDRVKEKFIEVKRIERGITLIIERGIKDENKKMS